MQEGEHEQALKGKYKKYIFFVTRNIKESKSIEEHENVKREGEKENWMYMIIGHPCESEYYVQDDVVVEYYILN